MTLSIILVAGFFGVKIFFKRNGDVRPLKIGIMDWAGFYPIIYASTSGLIDPNSIELIKCKDNPDINDKLTKGEIDMGFGAFVDHVLIGFGGTPIRVIYLSDYSKSDSLLVDSEIKNIQDLKGKFIGIGDINSFSEFFVHSLLSENGFKEEDAIYKIIPFDKIIDNIKEKKIIAGHTWEPEISKGRLKGLKVITSAAAHPGIVTDTLAARTSVLEKQKERIQNIVAGIVKATEALSKNPEIGASAISQYFSISTQDVVRRLKEDMDLIDYDRNLMAFTQKEGWTSLMWQTDKIAEFYRNRGQVAKDLGQIQILDPQFLNAINKLESP